MARDRNEIKKGLPELEAMLIDFLFDCGVGAKHINCKKVLEYAPKIQGLCDRLTNRRKKALEQLSEIPNDLAEAANDEYPKQTIYAPKSGSTIDLLYYLRKAFISGAKWQAEKCDEETSKLLYAERQTAYINGWDDHKEQMPLPEDTVIFNKGVEEGKRLMMEEAVEADVKLTLHDKTGDISLHTGYLPKELGIKCDDKVRIIIVKEEKNGQSD